MTSIHAPAGVKSAGIGFHVVFFVNGVAEDPGLNAGERAHWQGLGYRFVDDEHPEDVEQGPEQAPAQTAAKSTRRRTAKPKAAPVEDVPAPAEDAHEQPAAPEAIAE